MALERRRERTSRRRNVLNRRIAAVVALALLATLLSGCWSRRELNELSITLGLGIDKKGDQYVVSAQVVDPSQVASRAMGGGERSPVTLYRTTAPTISEGLRKLTTTAPRLIYLAHLRIVIFGEELARSGISDALDYLSRQHETRTDFYFAIAKGTTAENVLNVMTPLEKIPANNLYASLHISADYWSPTHGIFLDELINGLSAYGKSPAISGVRIVYHGVTLGSGDGSGNGSGAESGAGSDAGGDGNSDMGKRLNEVEESELNVKEIESPVELYFSGIAVFRKDRLIGWLNSDESRGYNYIQGHVHQSMGHVQCPDGGKISTDIIRTNTKLTARIVDGKPRFLVSVTAEGNVTEVACNIDLENPATIPQLNEEVNQSLKKFIEKAIYAAQHKFKTDFLGLGYELIRSYPKVWKDLGDNWNEKFTSMPIDVKVDYRLRRIGTISNSLRKDLKE